MIRKSHREIKQLNVRRLHSDELPDFAYALRCCKFPATTNPAGQETVNLCSRKIAELRSEALRRLEADADPAPLVETLLEIDPRDSEATVWRDSIALSWDGLSGDPHLLRCILSALSDPDFPKVAALRRKIKNWLADRQPDSPLFFEVAGALYSHDRNARRLSPLLDFFADYLNKLDFSNLSRGELLVHYRLGPLVGSLRRHLSLEPLTRCYQARIVSLLSAEDNGSLAGIFRFTETLESSNYSRLIDLPYRTGDLPSPFHPGDFTDDHSLIRHIRELALKRTYCAREQLICIADHVQQTIVAPGETADHLPLIDAILNTGLPCFDYPRLTSALERTTLQLVRTNSRPGIELAPIHHTLWTLTGKTSHLARFERTLRHCYFALTSSRTFPDLGVDPNDSLSIAAAISLLTTHRRTLLTLSPTYTLRPLLGGSNNNSSVFFLKSGQVFSLL